MCVFEEKNLPKYGGAITKPCLVTVHTIVFVTSILSNAFVKQVKRLAVFIKNTFQFINIMMKFDKIRAQAEIP